ncbi:MAG: hypothetical protein GY746_10850 [Gammaproteobacteria bacterium]|nr:hypothetical protein [Gammaproteobacteria bacterium]
MVKDLLNMDELEINKVYPVPTDTQQQIYDFHQSLESSDNCIHFKDEGVTHYVNGGIYAREMFIPAGLVIIGKIYKQDHICIISKGLVDVIDRNGRRRIKAPYTFTENGGTQRVVLTLEDTLWTTINTTDLQDPNEIMDNITSTDYNYFGEEK